MSAREAREAMLGVVHRQMADIIELRARATRAEAHAERLGAALELIANGSGENVFVPTSEDSGMWRNIKTYAREALSLYRSETS